MHLLDAQMRDLERLEHVGRLRSLVARNGVDFSSNDYLGLAGSGALARAVGSALARGVPIGSGGSRLLRGNHEEHEKLEAEAAEFFGVETALFLSSGYAANATLLATLPQSPDRIFADQLVHASCHEGLRLTRASYELVPHNSSAHFSEAIFRWRRGGGTGRPWIVVESLYSMEGDQAPLDDLLDVARRHEAMLIVDEAHATGVFGTEGKGLAARLRPREQLITIHTCGKALGCEGALVCGPRVVRDFLINRGRGFIFSTAPSPLMAAAVQSSLRLIRAEEQREALFWLVRYAERVLGGAGVEPSGSQILKLVIGDDRETMRIAARVQAAGFDVRGIRPPTVPTGTSRLRISVTLNASAGGLDSLAAVLRSLRQ